MDFTAYIAFAREKQKTCELLLTAGGRAKFRVVVHSSSLQFNLESYAYRQESYPYVKKFCERYTEIESEHPKDYPETRNASYLIGLAVALRTAVTTAKYADQFTRLQPSAGSLKKRKVTTTVTERDREIRDYVLYRAQGKCEYCGKPAFKLPSGEMYLETHHVIPISERGEDSVINVAALCPNHHREAHYGSDAGEIRKKLLAWLQNWSVKASVVC